MQVRKHMSHGSGSASADSICRAFLEILQLWWIFDRLFLEYSEHGLWAARK